MSSSSENSRLAFHRLDPILRVLLASIERYRSVQSSSETLLENQTLLENEERILGLLRAQSTMMENFEAAMKDVVETYGSGSLLPLTDYILLPLRLLLQSSDWNVGGSSIRKSAIWKSVQAAAHALESFVVLVKSLPAKQTVDCLVACAMSLPTDETTLLKSKGLDSGDDCLTAVLHCVDTLLNSSDYHEEIAAALNGFLVGRIAYACITFVSSGDSRRSPEVQLQALQTLDSLLKAVPLVKLWQSHFPGCFAGLCGLVLSELRLAAAQASPKVSSEACRVLSRLLCLTLVVIGEQECSDESVDALTRIRDLAIRSDTPPHENSEFFVESRARLPAPLVLLMNLLPTASSPKLRQAATELCHAILVETRSVWDQEETSNVPRAAIECCIALFRDTDERVVASSKAVIADYQRESGKRCVDSVVGPRVVELIQELPALARSGRETELQARINLVCGYLTLGVPLNWSLMSVAQEIRTSLAALFDVDFDSIQYAPRVSTMDELWNVPDRRRFRLMRDETAMSAQHMVRLLGDTVGHKAASVLVDACIADVLEASTDVSHSRSGPRQVDWLHEWIGYIIIAHEILVGAFGELSPELGDERNGKRMRRKSDPNVRPLHGNQKRRRRLHSLAAAILPIVISDPLWNLPTVLHNVDNKSGIERTEISAQNLIQSGTMDELMVNTVSASALKGNAALVCSLIGIVNATVELLSNDTNSFLPVILYPLSEKASSQNHSQVQHSATFSLHQVALACEMGSIKNLFCQNFDYLFGVMLSITRLPGGHQTCDGAGFPTIIPSIVQVVLRNAVNTDGAKDEATPIQRSIPEKTRVSYVIELVNALVASFDRNLFTLSADVQLQSSTALDLIQIIDAALSFIASTFGLNLDNGNGLRMTTDVPEPCEDWQALLDPFRRREGHNDDRSTTPAKEGFEKIQNERDTSSDEASNHPCIDITNGELDFVNLALERCFFLLSLSSLHVQVSSCVTLQHAFVLLGYIAMYTKTREDEPNGPETAILRHISRTWPSMINRIRALSSVITKNSSVNAASIRTLHSSTRDKLQDTSSQMSLLSKMFELMACMCEMSGDFMVTRIREQVWPIVAQLLDVYVREKQNIQHPVSGVISQDLTRKTPLLTAREKLLHSVLEFLSRVYGVRKCGVGLAGLIPAAGTIVLPFLADQGDLRARTMEAVKAMVMIDCDALWRPLLQLSRRHIPTRILYPQFAGIDANDEVKCETPLELAATELVAFIESLPEQSFEV